MARGAACGAWPRGPYGERSERHSCLPAGGIDTVCTSRLLAMKYNTTHYYLLMTATPETIGNPTKTSGNQEDLSARVEHISKQLDHIDTQVHTIVQFIEKYLPLIEKYANPGRALQGFLTGKGGRNGK